MQQIIEFQYSDPHMTLSWITFAISVLIVLAAIYYVVVCVLLYRLAKLGIKIFEIKDKKLSSFSAVLLLSAFPGASVGLCVLSALVCSALIYADVRFTLRYRDLVVKHGVNTKNNA